MYIYNFIFKDNSEFRDYYLNDNINSLSYITDLNTINIIIGANNSGKSRFMRKMMLVPKKNIIKVDNNDILKYNEIVDKYHKYIQNHNRRYSYDYESYKLNKIILGEDIDAILSENLRRLNYGVFGSESTFIELITPLNNKIYSNNNFSKKYYIPTLRTAHSLFIKNDGMYQKVEDDIFSDTINKYYDINLNETELFTGIHLYRQILNTRNSKRSIRKSFENFEKFIGENFFGGKEIDIVAEFNKTQSLAGKNDAEIISVHIEGESHTRDLYQLGDGIQALIILMYKIFMAEPNSIIFIDEPEINLHLGMQRLFLEQIYSNKILEEKNLTYFISTHSNHFLDLSLEKNKISILSFSPKEEGVNNKQFTIKNVNHGDNHMLRHLGVNNSSVFLANCSIWIEGISDRNYIKTFLKSYIKHSKLPLLKEDIDFAFFEYAGSNIDHYIFDKSSKVTIDQAELIIEDITALSLSNRIFLLGDSDNAIKSSKKGERLKKLEESKSQNFTPRIIWNIREIENLITNEMWKEVIIKYCNKKLIASKKNEVLNNINSALDEINYSNYKKDYIGKFLNEIREKAGKIGKDYIINQSTYEVKENGEFGTIINKRELSEYIFNADLSWSILSKNKDIEKLTIEIYNFITSGMSHK